MEMARKRSNEITVRQMLVLQMLLFPLRVGVASENVNSHRMLTNTIQ